MNVTVTNVETRPAAGAEAVQTNLTIEWDNMSPDDIRALAQQALIVKLQGAWRKNGIPVGDVTVKATDYKVGARHARQPKDIMSMIATLTPDQKAALMAKLTA